MTKKPTKAKSRASPPPLFQDEHPLLRILVMQAARRGDPLVKLAKALGVTYERLAQWRRGESAIGRAGHSVLEKAAVYLGVPVVVILALAGTVTLADFVWPGRESLSSRIGRDLDRLRHDPLLAAFVPAALVKADPAVQLLVAFLYRELNGDGAQRMSNYFWISALHQATLGHTQGQKVFQALQKEVNEDGRLF